MWALDEVGIIIVIFNILQLIIDYERSQGEI